MPKPHAKPQDFSNPFADLVPVVPGVTCTGRRVVAIPFDSQSERMVLRATDDPEDMVMLPTKLAKRHCQAGGVDSYREIENYNDTITLAEEQDMLLLVRIASYGEMFQFRYTCPACQTYTDAEIDLWKQRRRHFLCGNDECECHKVNEEIDEVPEGQFDFRDFKQRWADVPENHLLASPPKLVFEPDWVGGLRVHFRHPGIAEKLKMAMMAIERNERTIQVSLEDQVERIVWDAKDIDTKEMRDIRRYLKLMPEKLRLQIKDFVANASGGVDTRVWVRCSHKKCRVRHRPSVPIGQDFFLPARTDR